MIRTLLIPVFLLCISPLFAQNGQPPTAGARSTAMGYTGVTFQDANSLFSNQAGIAYLGSPSVVLHTERRFLVEGMNSVSAGFAYPTSSGTFGLSVNYFGFDQYNEQRIGLAYGRKLFDELSIGAQVDYIGTRIPEYGSSHNFTFEIGLQSNIGKKFVAGAHVFSPVKIQLSKDLEDVIPAQYNFGLAYLPSNKVTFTVEVEKDIDFPLAIKAGLEYRVVEKLSLRLGGGSQPSQTGFGLGVHLNNLDIDLASSYHWVLGFTPSLSISYKAKKKPTSPNKQSELE